MATQAFLWVVLPNGIANGRLKFSAFVAPRLDPQHADGSEGTLAEFTFGNWAQRMQSLSVSVVADSHPTPIAATRDTTGPALDPSLWALLFPGTTRVIPYQFTDYSNGVEVVSFPVGILNGTVSTVYGGGMGSAGPHGTIPIGCVSPVGNPGSTGTGGNGHGCGGHGGDGDGDGDHDGDDGHGGHHHHGREGGHGGGDGGGGDCGGSHGGDGDGDGDDGGHCGGGNGQGGGGHGGGGGGGNSCTTLNAVENLLSILNGLEATLIQFGATPKTSRGETATSILARMGVTLTPVQRAFFDFQRFYNRYGLVKLPDPNAPAPPVPGWTDTSLGPGVMADFHTIVGMLGDYPRLLRRLGLVMDFTIDAAILGSTTTGLTLNVNYPAPPGPAVTSNPSPKTMATTHVGRGWFRAADRPGSLVADGMLTLDNTTAFTVVQGQIDGTLSKVVDFGVNEQFRVNPLLPRYSLINGTLQLLASGQFNGTETCATIDPTTNLPALRSGVQLVQNGRGDALQSAFLRQAQFNSELGSAVLFSDDVMRGYRVDVLDRGSWRSLCARTGTVTVSNGATATDPIADEGYVKAVTGTRQNLFPFELFVHESLWGWDNWSLVAPRPGLTTSDPTDRNYTPNQHVIRVPNSNVDTLRGKQAFQFEVSTALQATPHTLPRLRFGSTYNFRARVVDLAGNSLSLGGVPTDHATPNWTYQRMEPVLSPAVVPTERFAPGESLEQLVIRNEDPSTFSKRFLAPPKTSQLEMEIHGKLDPFFDSQDAAGAFNLSKRESGTYLDAKSFQGDPNAVLVTNNPNDAEVPVSSLTVRGKALPMNAQYMIYRGASLPLPYLPDPLAHGVGLFVDPTGAAVRRNFDGPSWDTVAPIRIELHPTTGANPTATPGSGADPFVVSLPPATILDVDYVSTMREADLGLMWCWNNGQGVSSWTPAQAAHGEVTQLTPHRTLRMVHAVKKPLEAAALTSATLTKQPGDTFASVVTGSLTAHSRSTGEIEVWAQWTETQDLLPNPPQTGVARKAFAYRISIPYGDDNVSFPVVPAHQVASVSECSLPTGAPNARIDFGDTKYRSLQFFCTAATRYAEYYDPAEVADPSVTTLVGAPSAASYTVYSSATGPIPDIAYVVPTFRWDTSSETQHTRGGGSVRIYLNRPWFQTGDGELLAVMVANVTFGFVDVDDTVRPYVSEWGFDPVFQDTFSNANTGFFGPLNNFFTTLTAARVVSAAAQASNGGTSVPVVPSELALTWPKPPAPPAPAPPLPVIAVGHKVQYSKERDLWYTDVELDIGGAYAPMVRLAVARFQPNSVPGARLEVSKVVRIDCVQLTSSRTASIARPTTGGALNVTMSGSSAPNAYGINHGGSAGAGHQVVATVETRPTGSTEFDWSIAKDSGGNNLTTTLSATGPAAGDTTTTWSGSIPNAPKTGGGVDVRLKLEEFEVFDADPGPGQATGMRPVFVDTFPVNI